ncbi:hypothetical protein [Chlamydia sp. 17-3921]|uniref:hypothetical protein n=1 Tax=Chlamydia sp. 17-3921 TaxID=2675798 RepID=UPI001918DD63|nr:hypothetical protein [Chlamydia sp. 17-3921]
MTKTPSLTPPSGGTPTAIQFSQKELSIQKQKQVAKITCLGILGTLATITCVLGVALSVVFANPVFLIFFIATALFTVVAAITYLHLTAKTSSDWEKSLENYFNKIPAQAVLRNFITKQGDFTFYQVKANPKFNLGIQGDYKLAFSPALLATIRGVKAPGREGMIFNVVDPKEGKISNVATNLSSILYSTAMKYGDWHRCDTRGLSTKAPEPFLPTEARFTQYTEFTKTLPQINNKEQIPSHLGHVRGPSLDEFPQQDENAAEGYYHRALLAYEEALEAAVQAKVVVVALPLFSSTYEVPQQDKSPQKGRIYEWPMECNLFCKKALIEAVHNTAQKYPTSQLLVLLQDPFSPLAEGLSTSTNTWAL